MNEVYGRPGVGYAAVRQPYQKHLAILRHAKSSWADPQVDDHDRPLNARGRHAATLVGQHLRAADRRPDLVLCSSATRARQTLDLLDIPTSTHVLIENEIYGASAGDLLLRLRQISGNPQSLLLIGHNPGVEDLVGLLIMAGTPRPQKFPTAAVALLDLPVQTWTLLEPGTAELREFVVPRDLE